ncbi:hypothetical protein PV325_002889 [Microctonus aethiopoides]|nr:hypothetical protein PV325_002889 [Microctonus aethiopoides]
MNPRFLFIIVVLLQSVVFAQYSNDSLENSNDDAEIAPRIFGFEETTDECTRIASNKKEKIIGITFNLLCRHFGSSARDEIMDLIKIGRKNVPQKQMEEVFTHCLNIMKPKMISCFEIIFDGYDLAGTESPPKCLKKLAIFPEVKLQIFWLKKFPLILEFLDRVIKGYKIFNPARSIAEKYLDQGIIEHWKHISHLDYAKTIIEQWNSLQSLNKDKRLKEALGEPSNILDLCVFSNEWLRNPHNFEENVCLRKIIANLLILEVYLQKENVTLETELIFGRYFLLHLLHIVKSVIRSRSITSARKAMIKEKEPIYETVAALNDLTAANIQCLNDIRRRYDQTGEKLSQLLKAKELQDCLDRFVAKTENVSKPVKEVYLKQIHAPILNDVKVAEKAVIKSVMRCHNKMKPLQPVIQNMVDHGVPPPGPKYPWANNFLKAYKASSISNNLAKLGNAHFSSSHSSSTSCKRTDPTNKKNCWENFITQNMIVEKELQQQGLTMQQLYLGDPARTNLIYYIDEALRKHNLNQGRILAQYRRNLQPLIDTEAIMDLVMSELPDNSLQRIDNSSPSKRMIGQLPDRTVTETLLDDTLNQGLAADTSLKSEYFTRTLIAIYFYRISYALVKGALDPTVGVIVPTDKTMGFCADSETEDYVDASKTVTNAQADSADDYDQYEINEFESPVSKSYFCAARSASLKNDSTTINKGMDYLDEHGIQLIRSKKHHYQVRTIRQKMCQAGFNVFYVNAKSGSIHKRFKNVIRLMVYNTPGIFPGLKVIRSDLDRKRKREPQVWFRFELSNNPLSAEFDYDNYFITINGDLGRIQAYSKMLVALKMHKRLNNFNDSISYKVNLDLGIMEIVLANFGVALMRDKSTTKLMVKALNGIRTEINNDGEVQVEFEESMKDAVDQIDPLMYSSIWLQSMAEKFEVVKMKEKSKSTGKEENERTGVLIFHALLVMSLRAPGSEVSTSLAWKIGHVTSTTIKSSSSSSSWLSSL